MKTYKTSYITSKNGDKYIIKKKLHKIKITILKIPARVISLMS